MIDALFWMSESARFIVNSTICLILTVTEVKSMPDTRALSAQVLVTGASGMGKIGVISEFVWYFCFFRAAGQPARDDSVGAREHGSARKVELEEETGSEEASASGEEDVRMWVFGHVAAVLCG